MLNNYLIKFVAIFIFLIFAVWITVGLLFFNQPSYWRAERFKGLSVSEIRKIIGIEQSDLSVKGVHIWTKQNRCCGNCNFQR
jgi:hypothetical protein